MTMSSAASMTASASFPSMLHTSRTEVFLRDDDFPPSPKQLDFDKVF